MSRMAKREVFSSLTSRFKKKTEPLRPPYNEDSTLFHTVCPQCEDTPCVTLCEEEIIKIDEEKKPYLDFSKSGCTFCKECANACPHLVLEFLDDNDTIAAKVSIDTKTCLAWNEVMCSSCLSVCDARAIEFFGLFRPTVNIDTCTACGFCKAVCPADSLVFSPQKEM